MRLIQLEEKRVHEDLLLHGVRILLGDGMPWVVVEIEKVVLATHSAM